MPYVARYTLNPDYDVVRRWTGYMGCDALTPEMVAEHILDTHGMPFPARVKIDGEWIDWDETPWEWRIDWVLERADIRLHEPSGLWMWVHNPSGLSVGRFRLRRRKRPSRKLAPWMPTTASSGMALDT